MHFGYVNVNSLFSKLEELRTLAFNTNTSVLGITETNFDNSVSNKELKLYCCKSLQSDRTKVVVGLLAISKIILHIIGSEVFLKKLKILFYICYYLNQIPSM